MDVNKLRGAVYGKYKSASACASSMGWTKQKLNNIINGKQIPNVDEIKQIAIACQMSNDEMLDIFLSSRSQN